MSDNTPAKKPAKKARAKKPEPTKDEMIACLTHRMCEIKQEMEELREDRNKLQTMIASGQLRRVPELLSDALEDCQEELDGVEYDHANLVTEDVVAK